MIVVPPCQARLCKADLRCVAGGFRERSFCDFYPERCSGNSASRKRRTRTDCVISDFRTPGTIPSFGIDFDARTFAAVAAAHVDSMTLFPRCHHGYSYHPTAIGTMHPGLSCDEEYAARIVAYLNAGGAHLLTHRSGQTPRSPAPWRSIRRRLPGSAASSWRRGWTRRWSASAQIACPPASSMASARPTWSRSPVLTRRPGARGGPCACWPMTWCDWRWWRPSRKRRCGGPYGKRTQTVAEGTMVHPARGHWRLRLSRNPIAVATRVRSAGAPRSGVRAMGWSTSSSSPTGEPCPPGTALGCTWPRAS